MTSSRQRLLAVSYNLLGFNAMSLCTQLQRFQRNMLSQSLQKRRPENGSGSFLQRSCTYLLCYMASHFMKIVTSTENRFLYLYVHAAQIFLSFYLWKCNSSLAVKEKSFSFSEVTIPYPLCVSSSHDTDKECGQTISFFRVCLKI
jgi:hypothetical protein